MLHQTKTNLAVYYLLNTLTLKLLPTIKLKQIASLKALDDALPF